MKNITVLSVTPKSEDYVLEDIKATPNALSQLLGGSLNYVELMPGFGFYCRTVDEGTTLPVNFTIFRNMEPVATITGPVAFTKVDGRLPIGMTEDECAEVARNLVDMSGNRRVLFLDKITDVVTSDTTDEQSVADSGLIY